MFLALGVAPSVLVGRRQSSLLIYGRSQDIDV